MTQLLLALLAGTLAGCTPALTVLAARVGHGDQRGGWTIWYLTSPVIGAVVAAFLYATVRGGLLTAGSSHSADISLFGLVAIAAIGGLFSRKVMERLATVLGGMAQAAAKQTADPPARSDGSHAADPAEAA